MSPAPQTLGDPVRFRIPGVTAPDPDRQAGVWPGPLPPAPGMGAPDPHWWWLGAHGGAGVSTLTAVAAVSGDARRGWPSGHPAQSPNVVVVCRTHTEGLLRARDLLRQHGVGAVPPALRVLGLVTVADAPGKAPAEIRRVMTLVGAAAPAVWHLPWIDSWRGAQLHELPVSNPHAPPPALPDGGRRGGTPVLPPEYLGCVTAIYDRVQARRTGPPASHR